MNKLHFGGILSILFPVGPSPLTFFSYIYYHSVTWLFCYSPWIAYLTWKTLVFFNASLIPGRKSMLLIRPVFLKPLTSYSPPKSLYSDPILSEHSEECSTSKPNTHSFSASTSSQSCYQLHSVLWDYWSCMFSINQ